MSNEPPRASVLIIQMLETSQFSLRQEQHPLIRQLADRIIDYWQQYLELSPMLYPKVWVM